MNVGSMTQRQVRYSIILVTLLLVSTVGIHFATMKDQNLHDNESVLGSSPNSMEVLMLGNSYTQANNLESLTELLLNSQK